MCSVCVYQFVLLLYSCCLLFPDNENGLFTHIHIPQSKELYLFNQMICCNGETLYTGALNFDFDFTIPSEIYFDMY